MSSPVYSPNLSPIPIPDTPHSTFPIPDAVKSGRRRTGTIGTVTISATAMQFISADSKRVALRISSSSANRFTISDNPNVTLDGGLTIPAGGAPVEMTIEVYGQLITKRLYAIAAAGGTVTGFVESRLEDT